MKITKKQKLVYGSIISIITLVIGLITFYYNIIVPNIIKPHVGTVILNKPAGYGIIKGSADTIKKFSGPSDHLFLPLEWVNSTVSHVAIKNIELTLSEIGQDGKEKIDGEKYNFLLAGEYANITDEILKNEYTILN